jgi:hypothetical protein
LPSVRLGKEEVVSFDQRKNAFEAEFAHREELKFKVRERAVRSLAVWAAQRLGKASQSAEAYAREIVALDVANPRLDVTIDRIAADLQPAGVTQLEVRRAMEQFLAQTERSAHDTA